MSLQKVLKFMLSFLIIFMISCAPNNKLELTNKGASKYEIVIAENASTTIRYAVEELQNYIEKISTAKIPIVTEENQTEAKHKLFVQIAVLDENQIKINSESENITISGGSDIATRNAVYEFLETYLNCKWYASNVEVIPSSKSITIAKNINYSYTPEITTRTVHSRLFYENTAFANKHKVTTEAFPYYVPSGRVHTFNKFIPEETFYKSNPEYFAWRGGNRLPTQLCLTNDAVYRIVKDSVRALFERHPESSVISVSSNDNTQYCECEHCKKIDDDEGSHSGTMIQFVNKIAADFPDKTISTLAYQYTRKPSKTKPLENVLITLCSIECDRSASIEEKCTDFADDIRGWREITNNIRIWDYTTQFTNFLAPFPNIHTLQPNIKFFRDNHAKWVFEQHSNNPSELFELRSYIMAKLLWNPDLDVDNLITEFTNGYYQEAGIYIKKYIDLVHEKIKEDKDFFLFLYGDPSQAFDSFLNPELLKKYNDFFDEAEKVVINNSEILLRVKNARISVDYAILEACRKGISDNFKLVITNEKGEKNVNPFVREKLTNFHDTCKKNNITLMNEMGFTVEEYYKTYEKAIEVAAKPNKAKGKNVMLLTKPKKYANEDPKVLTDGALGGSNFYANWLGFEGNDLIAIIDLESVEEISSLSIAFLQVTNHIVFFPKEVTYYGSIDGKTYTTLGTILNDQPLSKTSKVNDIKYFNLNITKTKSRFIKINAINYKKAPFWHNAAGLPSWVFADEIIVN